MSVAFRRDSDEEHLEPRFELPVPVGPNLVTARGLAQIDDRIAELDSRLEAEMAEDAVTAIKRDLRYWRTRRITAEVAPVPAGDKVEFGVQASILLKGIPRTFCIVGHDEADPVCGKLSFRAPLSLALLGAEVDEVLPFGGVADAIRIVTIELPRPL